MHTLARAPVALTLWQQQQAAPVQKGLLLSCAQSASGHVDGFVRG